MKKYVFILFGLLVLSVTSMAQNIAGIGAQLFLDTAGGYTMPRILSLVQNSPADKYLNATDYIIKVNDTSCRDKTIETIVSMIRGEAGTHIKITTADTKDGKNAKDHDLVRVGMQVGPQDPVATFYTECEGEVQQLKTKGFTIVKTFNSACGNYFFNFDALPRQYHVQVMALQEKSAGGNTPAFYVTASVFDSNDKTKSTEIPSSGAKDLGQILVMRAAGSVTFSKSCIGVINVQLHDDATRCHAMYVVVYK